MVADEITLAPARAEALVFAARCAKRFEERLGQVGAKTVDHQRDRNPTLRRRDQSVAQLGSDAILEEDVEAQFERVSSRGNQFQQCGAAIRARWIEHQRLALGLAGKRFGIGVTGTLVDGFARRFLHGDIGHRAMD